MKRAISLLLGAIFVLNGCATDRVMSAAQSAGKTVSSFQADLTKFQSTVDGYRTRETSRIADEDLLRDQALDDTARLQVEWTIGTSKDTPTIFQLLQKQGQQETSGLLTVAQATPSATAPLPLDKLGSVAKTMEDISKPPGFRADLEVLIQYGSTVNADMKPPATSTPKP